MGVVVYLVSFKSVSRENGKADSVTTVVLLFIDMRLQDVVYVDREPHDFHQLVTTQRGS